MNPAQYIATLEARGVQLWLDTDSRFRYRAPKGLLTPAVADRIRTAAPQLVPLLRDKPAPETVDNVHSFTAPLSYREMLLSAFSESWRTVAEVQAALPADFPAADEDAVTELLEEAQRTRSIERREFTGVWKWRLVPLSESGITDPFALDANPFPAEEQEVLFSE